MRKISDRYIDSLVDDIVANEDAYLAAKSRNATSTQLRVLARHPEFFVRQAVAENPKTPKDVKDYLKQHDRPDVELKWWPGSEARLRDRYGRFKNRSVGKQTSSER